MENDNKNINHNIELEENEQFEMERMKAELLKITDWSEEFCEQKATRWAKGCFGRFVGTRNLTMQAEGIVKAYKILQELTKS